MLQVYMLLPTAVVALTTRASGHIVCVARNMNASLKRLRKEAQDAKKDPETEIVLFPNEDNIRKWRAFIEGPPDTPFEKGIFELSIDISSMYPMEPPDIKFVTKVFHPNVLFKDGSICLDILKREWSPAWSLRSACRAVIAILSDPNADSPLNCDAGNMIRAGDMLAYNCMAALYREEYALKERPFS